MLKALCFVSLAALGLAGTGCKDITKDAEALADRACACRDKHDKACADKVIEDLAALLQENKHASVDEDRVKAAGAKIGTCAIEAGVDSQEMDAKVKPAAE